MDRREQRAQASSLVPPARFAELTGLTRDRLRAWERRYGFPVPVRQAGGPRRYRLADVARVVAVRRAHEEGVPIAEAVARTEPGPTPAVDPAAFRAVVEGAPAPTVLLTGPEPLRAVHVNAALRAMPRPPVAGEELATTCPDLAGSRLVAAVRQHFARRLPPSEVAHPAWTDAGSGEARSVVLPVPTEPGTAPLVAVVGLGTSAEHDALFALAAQEEELAVLRHRTERHERWLDAIAELSAELRDEPGADVVGRALETLLRQTRAVDAALAAYAGGELSCGPGRRRVLAGGRLVVAAHPELAMALRDRRGLWLAPEVTALLGASAGVPVTGVPVAVGGEVLGLLLLAFAEEEAHDDDNRRLLAAVSAAMGFVLLRDRLAAAVSRPRRPASG